jgi:hypothetical protein
MILLLRYESNAEGTPRLETWQALLTITHKLAVLKDQTRQDGSDSIYYKVAHLTRKNIVNSPIFPTANSKSHLSLDLLPTELIYTILKYVNDQETLYNLLRTSKRMKNLISPVINRDPYLTSSTSLLAYLKTLSDYELNPRSISFGPSANGILSENHHNVLEFLPFVHSGLFNYLIRDRNSKGSNGQLVHPIFYAFAHLTNDETIFEEYSYNKEPRSSQAVREPFVQSNLEISQIHSSSLTLQTLLKACRKWDMKYPEWSGTKWFLGDSLQTCILLMEWFQGDFYPIWHLLGGETVRLVRPLIQRQCRALLSHIYSTLLLQVRFITSNSQRLLDCYCVIYYRVLSVAQILNVEGLLDAIGEENLVVPETVGLRDRTPDNLSQPLLNRTLVNLPNEINENQILITELPESRSHTNPIRVIDQTKTLSEVQKLAVNIYKSLIMIFHLRIPSEVRAVEGIPIVPLSTLTEILVTFPPSSVNKETVEFIEPLSKTQLPHDHIQAPVLNKWCKWLGEIVKWNDASIEMDPVKELLRKSMDKIDFLRTIQVQLYLTKRRYGLLFMD